MVFLYGVEQSSVTNFPILSSVLETYSRHIKVGDSEAWCGAHFIVLLVRAFTPGEDAVMKWVQIQDEAALVDMVSLKDGRDYIILRRTYVKQSYRDALREQAAFANGFVQLASTQHDTGDTPKGSFVG